MSEEFSIGFRGYERDEVDRALAQLRNEVETLRQTNENLRSELDASLDQVKALAGKVKSLPDKPSYANLGAQFEEVLRLGEEKAERLVAEAKAEADLLRESSSSKAARVVREADERARQLVADASARADELRLTSETVAAERVTQANLRLAEASEAASTARREAAAMIAEAEREIAESRAAFQREMDAERAAINELAERTQRERVDAEELMRMRAEEFERTNLQRHQDAVELSNRLINEANQKAAEVSARASEIAIESETLLTASRQKADEMVSDARKLAAGLLDQAQLRANELSERTRRHIDTLLNRASARIESLRDERELLDSFVTEITDVRSTDMLINQYEEHFRNEDSSL